MNHIVWSHFIVADGAQISSFVYILWASDIDMLITKRTKCFGKFESAVMFYCTRQMEWTPARFCTASNGGAPFLAIMTELKSKNWKCLVITSICLALNQMPMHLLRCGASFLCNWPTFFVVFCLPIFSFSTLQLWCLLAKTHRVPHHLHHLAQDSMSRATNTTE